MSEEYITISARLKIQPKPVKNKMADTGTLCVRLKGIVAFTWAKSSALELRIST
jgi:hypothetical protein